MRERHVAHAELVVGAQDGQRVADGVAALDPDERRDLARPRAVRLQDVC